MLGSGLDDGEVLEIGPDKPRRSWAIGRRSRVALAVVGICALLAAGGTFAGLRLGSRGPARPRPGQAYHRGHDGSGGSGPGPDLYAGSLAIASDSGNSTSTSIPLFDGFSSPAGR